MTSVFLYVPNIIGYIRLALIFSSCFFYSTNAVVFISLYLAQSILDGLDGALARKLKQTSAFGAWFDVVIDNLGRGMLWCRLFKWGYFIAAMEWLVFVCTHSLGAQWKTTKVQAPWIVSKVMEKNFKTPLGTFTILGLFVLPLWLYAHYTGVLGKTLRVPISVQYAGIAFLSTGRAFAFAVESHFVYSHILYLTRDEDK
ncbi:uncharacterized protein LOC129254778 [Lytechinus pictus]|uniref:uncharacterized protein LOC129254778 n=1 Tax=Lytechinus pictus TaxID=7653 RepID=UPI0030BA0370